MTNFLNIISVLILFSSFVLVANKRVKSYIKTFKYQSMLIALATGIMGVNNLLNSGHFDTLIVCFLIIALKVIYIPNLLNKSYDNVEYKVEKDFFYNIPLLILICCVLTGVTYICILTVAGINPEILNVQVINSISVVMIGLFFMISRKKVIGQMVGFLVIENGLFVTGIFSTQGMPFIVDIGIFIDLLTAIMVMGLMVFKINEKFESIDTNKLNNLRG